MHSVTLTSWPQAHSVLTRAAAWIKPRILAGRSVVLTLDDERRNNAQNALLHAELSDLAREMDWAGKKRDVETWKRLCVAAWCRANNEPVELLPAIDGHGVDIVFRRTSTMTKAEVSDLIEYIRAFRTSL